MNVSPLTCNKMVESARSVLNHCLPDIYIYTDHRKRDQSGKSPGFGITLCAETTKGAFLCAEACSHPQGSTEGRVAADDLGIKAARNLLEEIYRGGCVDSANQSLACVLMAVCDQDVSKIQTGPLSNYTIYYLRHIRDFFRIIFKIDVQHPSPSLEEDGDDGKSHGDDSDDDIDNDEELKLGGDKVLLTCTGAGYRNLNKVIL